MSNIFDQLIPPCEQRRITARATFLELVTYARANGDNRQIDQAMDCARLAGAKEADIKQAYLDGRRTSESSQ